MISTSRDTKRQNIIPKRGGKTAARFKTNRERNTKEFTYEYNLSDIDDPKGIHSYGIVTKLLGGKSAEILTHHGLTINSRIGGRLTKKKSFLKLADYVLLYGIPTEGLDIVKIIGQFDTDYPYAAERIQKCLTKETYTESTTGFNFEYETLDPNIDMNEIINLQPTKEFNLQPTKEFNQQDLEKL